MRPLKINTIFQNFSYLLILRIFQIAINFLIFPYLIRVLGSENYGRLVYSSSICSFFTIIMNFGFNYSATRLVSLNRENPKKLISILNKVYQIKIFLLLICFISIILLLFHSKTFHNNIILIIGYFIVSIGDILFPGFYFQGLEKMKNIALVNIAIRIFSLISVILFINSASQYQQVPFILGAFSIIGGIYGLVIALRMNEIIQYEHNTIKDLFLFGKESIPFFFSNLGATIKDRVSSIIISSNIGYSEGAYFDLGMKIVLISSSAIGMLGQAFFPKFAQENNSINRNKILKLFVIIGLIISFSLFTLRTLIYKLLGGVDFIEYSFILGYLSISLFFLAISVFYGTLTIGGLGHGKYFSYGVLSGLVIYLLGLFILVTFDQLNLRTLSILYPVVSFSEGFIFYIICKKRKYV